MTFFSLPKFNESFFLPEDEADEEHVENGGNSVHQSVDDNLQKKHFSKITIQSNIICISNTNLNA